MERAFGKPFAKKQLNVVNSGMCSNSPTSKMNSAFIPSKLIIRFIPMSLTTIWVEQGGHGSKYICYLKSPGGKMPIGPNSSLLKHVVGVYKRKFS
jgi:hypothetical protein